MEKGVKGISVYREDWDELKKLRQQARLMLTRRYLSWPEFIRWMMNKIKETDNE